MLIIDRFEGDIAVIEWQNKTFDFPKELLPKEIKEGDIININVVVDKEATRKEKMKIDKMMDDLLE